MPGSSKLASYRRLLCDAEHSIVTQDREEALDLASHAISPMSVNFRTSTGAFLFRVGSASVGGMGVAAIHQASANGYVCDLDPERTAYRVEIPVEGRSLAKVGNREVAVAGGHKAVLSSPDERTVWDDDGNEYSAYSIGIPAETIASKFQALSGRKPRSNLMFRPDVLLSSAKERELNLLFEAVLSAASEKTSIYDNPLAAAQLEELLSIALITGLEHSHSEALAVDAKGTSHRTVERVRTYLHEHSAEHIPVEKLALISGASVRSLQRSFREVIGKSPTRYLKDVRLDRVRTRLLHGDRSQNVTEVAFSEGFTHLGNFAADYRRRFGETPSETARQRMTPRRNQRH